MMEQQKYDYSKAKEEYIEFCDKQNHDIQIFALPWYLDAACDDPNDWRVILYKEQNRIVAAFPFEYKKNAHGRWIIGNPWACARLGIWINYTGKTTQMKRELFENEITEYIIENLPAFDSFSVAFDSRYKNWRSFYNNGFSQKTFYSYIANNESCDINTISRHRRKEINKSKMLYSIERTEDVSIYWDFFARSYVQRGRISSYSKGKLEKLLIALIEHDACAIRLAKDSDGIIRGANIVIMDARRTYSMYGSFDPTVDLSPRPLLTWDAIQETISESREFDFEGSMIPGVAQFNMEFGAVLEPYFIISKYSPGMKLRMTIKDFISSAKKLHK